MIARRPRHDRLDTAPEGAAAILPPDLVLEPISRRPTVLPEATVRAIRNLPAGAARAAGHLTPGPSVPAARAAVPRVSIVVITRDNLVFSKLCLESVLANTDYPDYEVIAVDNGSGEEALSYLDRLTERHALVRVVRNETNRGFAAANNQGLARATGERFVLLNNDTIVPHGWLTPLIRHLDDPTVGAVGPVTNRIGNEAQIETSYRTYGELERFAREYTRGHAGECFEIPMLTMFCFATRRETYDRVGPLDEQYHIALFEDDDYAMRLRSGGYRLICAEDVFVHHFGGATLGSLLPPGESQALLRANRDRFQRKWGVDWRPHRRRPRPAYRRLVAAIGEAARRAVPAGAKVLVISRGDPDLLEIEGMDARHFPQDTDGSYAGYYPAGSAEAIDHLRALQKGGAGYLVIPGPALWWLEHYAGFAEYLAVVGEEVFRETELCVILRLRRPLPDDGPENP